MFRSHHEPAQPANGALSATSDWLQQLTWLDTRAEWVETTGLRGQLARVLDAWDTSVREPLGSRAERRRAEALDSRFHLAGLHAILHDVWASERGLQPACDVAVLRCKGAPGDTLAVQSSSLDRARGAICIHELCVHPAFDLKSPAWAACAGRLMDLASQASEELGFQGWVVAQPEPNQDVGHVWASLGFIRHDDLTYRRQGMYPVTPPDTLLQ
ncbi:MAG: hypothetical protein K6T78_02765 [Alicyclobacillus sp.]|nr:hypothetical protein [Alicyclobacillus sp.]